MVTGIMLGNEPNNPSHWDFQMDPEWRQYSAMISGAARALKEPAPETPLALGGSRRSTPRNSPASPSKQCDGT